MQGATLQSLIYRGYSKAAAKIGQTYNLYRPLSATAPLSNLVSTITAAFDSSPEYSFKAPNEYGDPTWSALLNDATTQVGDYISGNGETFFIAAKQFLLPVIAVDCNRTISVLKPQIQSGVGATGYGGNTLANETIIMSGWPANILQGSKGEKSETNLPGDTRTPWWRILLPYFAGVTIQNNFIITDDLGRSYVVSSAELTDLGWRISATQALT